MSRSLYFRPTFSWLLPACVSAICCGGCAGPTTPLGAPWLLFPQEANAQSRIPVEYDTPSNDRISFSPIHQVLHRPSPFDVTIRDRNLNPENYRVSVRYNGFDVTRNFMRNSKISYDKNKGQIRIHSRHFHLSPAQDHQIDITYQDSRGQEFHATYGPPVCDASAKYRIVELDDFDPPHSLLRMLDENSKQEGINPALLAGLVAAESSFDPKKVSWAGAIGLTQVTPVAQKELSEFFPTWPRYPESEKFSSFRLKHLISSGRMNPSNDWRLDPRRSLKGGLAYLNQIRGKWNSEDLKRKLRGSRMTIEEARTRLALASYHSGPSRVMNAVNDRGSRWIRDPKLTEARKYVNRIYSYCDHFSEKR